MAKKPKSDPQPFLTISAPHEPLEIRCRGTEFFVKQCSDNPEQLRLQYDADEASYLIMNQLDADAVAQMLITATAIIEQRRPER